MSCLLLEKPLTRLQAGTDPGKAQCPLHRRPGEAPTSPWHTQPPLLLLSKKPKVGASKNSVHIHQTLPRETRHEAGRVMPAQEPPATLVTAAHRVSWVPGGDRTVAPSEREADTQSQAPEEKSKVRRDQAASIIQGPGVGASGEGVSGSEGVGEQAGALPNPGTQRHKEAGRGGQQCPV